MSQGAIVFWVGLAKVVLMTCCGLVTDAAELRIYYLGNSLTDELKYEAFVKLAESGGEKVVWETPLPGRSVVRRAGRRAEWNGAGGVAGWPLSRDWEMKNNSNRQLFCGAVVMNRTLLLDPPRAGSVVAGRWPCGWKKPVRVEMPLGDDFDDQELGTHWQFSRECDPKRFLSGGGAFTMHGRGGDAGTLFPLTIRHIHRAYEIKRVLEIEGDATAGLMLFFTSESYIGSAIWKDGVALRVQKGHRSHGWMKDRRIRRTHVELRIVNNRQDVRFYSRDKLGAGRSSSRAWMSRRPSRCPRSDGLPCSPAGRARPASNTSATAP